MHGFSFGRDKPLLSKLSFGVYNHRMTQPETFFHKGPQDYPVPDWSGYRVRAVQSGARPFPPAPSDIKSILVIKLDAYGDYLLHTPFYAGLRAFYPHAQITLVCQKNTLALAEHNPVFNYVIAPPVEPGYHQGASFLFAVDLQSHAAAPFDLIIVPRWHEDWHHAGVIAQTLDAPYRLCYAGNSTPFKAQNFPQHDSLFTHVIDDPRPSHEVWRGMQMLHALGMEMPAPENIRQEFHFTMEDEKKVGKILSTRKFRRPWIGFGIGASGDFKRWPAAHFAHLAARIKKTMRGTVFLLGRGTKDEAVAAEIPGVQNLVGQLSPRESGVLIRACNAVVCNDSYALHAAATVGTPIVEIIGQPADGNPSSEYLPWCFGPWGVPFAWLQPGTCNGSLHPIPDFRGEIKCIADVPVDAVFSALIEVTRRWPKQV